ncbi:hypothetical protein GPECTOR_7g1295 [Gonium pectorale]|uniref:Ysc84 actin-binding domain-containing protein n=1 Tax=Gonium pectorale TaxID=33097 RepID=A0A150GU85_GONPE|nr:hypothetical protein GPECTOR_7g1295 [Gonium pectorale]|eukprot:KXZ53399.1 hypothetical protein GPECTOR_7g1295 [Gonium pectorale]
MARAEAVLSDACRVLTTLRESARVGHIGFPVDALAAVEGFVLLHSHKGAALVGFESGHGAAFRVLRRGGGGTSEGGAEGGAEQAGPEAGGFALSAPVFVKLSKWAVGIQLGYSNVYSLLAFFHGGQLERLLAGGKQIIVGEDFEVSGLPLVGQEPTQRTFHKTVMHGVDGSAEAAAASADITAALASEAQEVRLLTVSESLMVFDLSMYGGSLAVDADLMDEAYGKGHAVLDVLHGNVLVPEHLKPLAARVAGEMAALTAL